MSVNDAREAMPTLPEACEPVSQVRRRAELSVVVAQRPPGQKSRKAKSRGRMPTLIGVGSELWIEPEQGAQDVHDAQAGAPHPQKKPRTLREDQPELNEAYRREAARIFAREKASWAALEAAWRGARETLTTKHATASSEVELAAE
ncbi:MAG: hypothetical protein H6718_23270 [Polyangiaceae bacterium]|nr:hypothetical protein [Myxococcales bacterium]MCB9588348.1 hypothetical protein [Polyangiaceae bacterium]